MPSPSALKALSFTKKSLNDTKSNLFLKINWSLLFVTLLLIGVGLVNLYSASSISNDEGIRYAPFFQKQVIWASIGFACFLVASFIDYHVLEIIALPFYVFVIILLALVPLIGVSVGGAKRWLDFGFMSFQPSEFAKFSVLIFGAKVLSRINSSLTWTDLFKITAILGIPFLFVATQPDLGSALMLIFVLGGMIAFHGIKWYVLRILLLLIPCVLPFMWFFLKDYQKQRILTFLDPSQDPHGAGYHIIQSQIAIGSGELFGKGFQDGSQNQLRFLPEKHTDFAVAVLGEEWGFAGTVLLLVLFCFFLYTIYTGARDAKNRFGSLICAGIFFYFFSQILINIGMVVGIMPVVGIPLPFISYGGSAMLVNCVLVGIVFNISLSQIFKNK